MKTVPLGGAKAAGRVAFVDDGDYDLVMQHRWHVRETQRPGRRPLGPYAITNVTRVDGSRTTLFMHNLIMGATRIDHADGNGLNNQRTNLRPASNGQNMHNRQGNLGHSSRYKGVTWNKRRRGWIARITLDGNRHQLGCFATEEDAARAYDAAAVIAFGEFARLNNPDRALVICGAHLNPVDIPARPTKRTLRSMTPAEQADMGTQYLKGQTVREVADAFDTWTSTVLRVLRRNGIPIRGPYDTKRARRAGASTSDASPRRKAS